MWGVDLSGADLSGSILTDTQYYNNATWTDAFYYTDNEPAWATGMDAAWRTSVGILALAPTSAVPEPAALFLALLGLALLPRRRRRSV
jgi:MYXO-CTERM domain-containing protein